MSNLFQPDAGSTQTISASSASVSAPMPLQAESFLIYNAGPGLVFARWGSGAQTALATDLPIPAGTLQTFGKEARDTIAVICPGSTATVYVTPGEGQ